MDQDAPRADIEPVTPSISGVLESVVGPWGSILVGVGLLISVLGAYLAWTLMGCEVVLQAARTGDMPAFLLKENSRGAQIGARIRQVYEKTRFRSAALRAQAAGCAHISVRTGRRGS